VTLRSSEMGSLISSYMRPLTFSNGRKRQFLERYINDANKRYNRR